MDKINQFRHQFSTRFHKLLDQRKYPPRGSGRLAKVKDDFNVSLSAAQKWLSGKSIPEPIKLVEICETLDCSIDWLLRGLPGYIPDVAMDSLSAERVAMLEKIGESVCLPHALLQGESGTATPVGWFRLSNEWLRDFGGIEPAQANAMRVHDNAMYPIISEGDYVIYSTGIQSFAADGIYLLGVKHSIFLRNVQLLLDGRYQISAANPNYAIQTCAPDGFTFSNTFKNGDERIRVIGKAEIFIKKNRL